MQSRPVTRRPSFYYAYIRSPQWIRIKHEFMRRVGWMCEKCHIRRAVLVHHNNYDRLGYEQPEDLTALCYKCHEELHRWPKAANDNQLQLPFKRKA